MNNIVKICKVHGELTEEKIYRWEGKRTRVRNGKSYTCNNIVIKCRKCANIMTENWQKKDIERRNRYQRELRKTENYRINNRRGFIKRKYNITPEHYDLLLESQNHVCAICKKRETTIESNSQRLKPLCIDHTHDESKKVRGLLCNRCNPMLGYAQDKIEILQAAIEYLRRHEV